MNPRTEVIVHFPGNEEEALVSALKDNFAERAWSACVKPDQPARLRAIRSKMARDVKRKYAPGSRLLGARMKRKAPARTTHHLVMASVCCLGMYGLHCRAQETNVDSTMGNYRGDDADGRGGTHIDEMLATLEIRGGTRKVVYAERPWHKHFEEGSYCCTATNWEALVDLPGSRFAWIEIEWAENAKNVEQFLRSIR